MKSGKSVFFTGVFVIALMILMPSGARAEYYYGTSSTILGFYEDNFFGETGAEHFTLGEYFNFTVEDIGDTDLVFHTYLFGQVNLERDSDAEDDVFELLVGSARYSFGLFSENKIEVGRMLNMSGPFPVYYDGLTVDLNLWHIYDFQVYGGFSVQPDYDFGSENPLAGARFQVVPNRTFRFGVSGLVSKLNDEDHYQIVGMDFDVNLQEKWFFSGNVDYDLSFENLSDLGLYMKFTATESIHFSVNYEIYYPSSYLGPDSIFSVFTLNEIRDFYAIFNYNVSEQLELYAEAHDIEFEYDNTKEAIIGFSYIYNPDAGNFAGVSALFQLGDYRYAQRLTGTIRHRLSDFANLTLRANAYFLDNENQLFVMRRKDRSTVSSLFAAFNLKINDNWYVTPAAEVAGTVWDNHDVRGYIKLTYSIDSME